MDKKQFTSWGVSFGSIALVGGMVSYLGLTNKDTANKANSSNQAPASSQNSIQQPSSQNGDSQNSIGDSTNDNRGSSSFGDDQAENDNGPAFNFGNDQSTVDKSQSSIDQGSTQQNDNQFSNRGSFGHHGRFDTTTGGT